MFNEDSPQYLALIKANTAFKTDARARAVVETLKWLDEGAPEKANGFAGTFKFDMSLFLEPDYDGSVLDGPPQNCGTACCIAGAIHVFEQGGVRPKEYDNDDGKDIDELFDLIVHPELDVLFFTENSSVNLWDVTAKGAAITLRRYIETGKVLWNPEEQI